MFWGIAGLTLILVLPWALAASTPWTLRVLDRAFSPSAEVVLIPIASMVIAISGLASLIALGSILLTAGDIEAKLAGVVCLAGSALGIVHAGRHLARVRASSRALLPLSASEDRDGDILIIRDVVPDAFATSVGGGVVVITTAMIDALSAVELDALIAHERAHLRLHHPLWIQVVESAAAVNPLLRAAAMATKHAAEREADEHAASGDREAAMRAVARAALVSTRYRRASPPATVGSTGGDVVRRVRALSDPAPAPTRKAALLAAVVLLALLTGTAVALFDVAQDRVSPEPGESLFQIFQ